METSAEDDERGELKEVRVALFKKLVEVGESYRRVNQWK